MAKQQTLGIDTVLLDEFKILGLLGSGGFGNTYLAHDLSLGRDVAIKEFFPSGFAVRVAGSELVEVNSPEREQHFHWALRRFVREARTLAKFRHPSVVRVFRVFKANETAYMVLEFVRGSNMEAWLKGLKRPPTQEEFDALLPPLLDALEVVHKAGILHRDIKPANIYIRAVDQSPVLLDFGAAAYAASGPGSIGLSATMISNGYSPTESYATDSSLHGPWTDIYSLAATLYRALSGSAPPDAARRAIEDTCVSATQLDGAEAYRPEFLRAIDHALLVMPVNRPQSIAAWRLELMADPGKRARIVDADGDPPTLIEWHPISEQPTDEGITRSTGGSMRTSHPGTGTTAAPPASASADQIDAYGSRLAATEVLGKRDARLGTGIRPSLGIGLLLLTAGVVALLGLWLFRHSGETEDASLPRLSNSTAVEPKAPDFSRAGQEHRSTNLPDGRREQDPAQALRQTDEQDRAKSASDRSAREHYEVELQKELEERARAAAKRRERLRFDTDRQRGQ